MIPQGRKRTKLTPLRPDRTERGRELSLSRRSCVGNKASIGGPLSDIGMTCIEGYSGVCEAHIEELAATV
jgi:hypothetical protein